MTRVKPNWGTWWPDDATHLDADDVVGMYKQGFVGAFQDPEAKERLDAHIRSMGDDPDGGNVAHRYGFAGSGAGKLTLLFPAVTKFYGYEALSKPAQGTGDCVSMAGRDVSLHLVCIDALSGVPDEVTGRVEDVPQVSDVARNNGVFANEGIYLHRGHNGQGMSCDQGLHWIMTAGGVVIRQKYDQANLESYNVNFEVRGSSGSPSWLNEIGKKHQVRKATRPQTHEQARDYLAIGCPIWTCSGLGFSDVRDANGYSRRSGSWAHSWHVVGYDDRPWTRQAYGFPLALFGHRWGCYDDKTEILTSGGWKAFGDLSQIDAIATLNAESGELQYQFATKIHRYRYDGNLVHFNWRGVDLMVTPNHRMYAGIPSGGSTNWGIHLADDIKDERFHVKKNADSWTGIDVAMKRVGNFEVEMDDWLRFLGYYISEGSCTKRVKRKMVCAVANERCGETGRYLRNASDKRESTHAEHIVAVAQLKQSGVDAMSPVMNSLPFRFRRTSGGWSKTSKSLYKELSSLGKSHEKFVPDYVKSLTSRQISIFIDALMVGDGSVSTVNGTTTRRYYTSSKRLADDVQELLLKVGKCGDVAVIDRVGRSNGAGGVTRHKEYCVKIKEDHVSPSTWSGKSSDLVEYHGDVHCVTVPNGIVYVRRNGVASWSGNSWNSGPRRIKDTDIDIPEGYAWIDARLLDQCWMAAVNSVNGWPKRNLPDYGFSILG